MGGASFASIVLRFSRSHKSQRLAEKGFHRRESKSCVIQLSGAPLECSVACCGVMTGPNAIAHRTLVRVAAVQCGAGLVGVHQH